MSVRTDKRESNFELLRIIAMLLIIAGHFVTQSGALEATTGINHWFAASVGMGHRMAVNLFVLIGTWFMVDLDFKPSRIIRLYGTVWFYSVLITLICKVCKVPVSMEEFVSAFFPVIRRAVWFASVYIGLMLLSPFLRKFRLLTLEIQRKAIIVLFLLVCVECTLSTFMDTYLCALTWFIFLYLFMCYHKECVKRDCSILKWNKIWYLLIGVAVYAAMIAAEGICYTFADRVPVLSMGRSLVIQYLSDYKSIPNFLSAFCIFLFFENWRMRKIRLINVFAGATFGVYVIHQIPVFYMFLWKNLCDCDAWINDRMFPLYTLAVIFCVFVAGVVIDQIRTVVFEPFWLHSPLFRWINRKMDRFYQSVNQDNNK